MADVRITRELINYYRSKPENLLLHESAIIEKIEKDIETGKLPKEFATLATDAQKVGYNANSSNVFGFGFNADTSTGLYFERTTPQVKQNEQQAKKIASSVKENSRWHKDWGGSSLVAECKKTTKDNILYTLKEFEKVSPDKNLVLTITDNSTIPVEKQKEALKHIFNVLCDLAKDKGVDTTHFEKAFKTNISQTRTETRISSTGMPSGTYTKEVLTDSNITTINNIIVGLRNSIEVKANPNVYNQIALALTPEKQIQERTIGSLQYKHSSSLESLENQNRYDGWAGELADWMSGAWGSKNREKHVRADLEVFNKQITELEEAKKVSKEAFEKKFEEIFGIKYDAELIVNYQQVEQLYQMATSCYQLEQFFKSDLKVLLSNSTLQEETKTVSIDPMTNLTQTTVLATKEQVFEREFNKLANFVGQGNLENGKQQLKDLFKASGLSETSTLQEKYTVLRQVAQNYAKVLHDNTMHVTGNKGYEVIAKDFDDAYKSAFGVTNDIARRVAEYNVSQQAGAGVIKSAVMIGGTFALGTITGGAGLSFFPALAITSVGAGVITATTEFSDRLSSGYVIEGFKENGIEGAIEGVKLALPDEEIIRILKSSGITTLAVATGGILGAGVEIGAQALNMSILTKSLVHIALGIGVGAGAEYLHTGSVSEQGVVFAFVLSSIGQVIAITKVGTMDNGKVTFDKQAIQQARQDLGLADDVVLTEEVLKKAYRKMSIQTHPDRGGTAEAFVKVKSAYDLLMQYAQPATATGVKLSSSQATTKSNSTAPAEANPNLPTIIGKEASLATVNVTQQNANITSRLATASSRQEFVTIRDEIKSMPAGAEKMALQQEYLKKYNEFSRNNIEKYDIKMEYTPSINLPASWNELVSREALVADGFTPNECDIIEGSLTVQNIMYIAKSLSEDFYFAAVENIKESLSEFNGDYEKMLGSDAVEPTNEYLANADDLIGIVKNMQITIEQQIGLMKTLSKGNHDTFKVILDYTKKNISDSRAIDLIEEFNSSDINILNKQISIIENFSHDDTKIHHISYAIKADSPEVIEYKLEVINRLKFEKPEWLRSSSNTHIFGILEDITSENLYIAKRLVEKAFVEQKLDTYNISNFIKKITKDNSGLMMRLFDTEGISFSDLSTIADHIRGRKSVDFATKLFDSEFSLKGKIEIAKIINNSRLDLANRLLADSRYNEENTEKFLNTVQDDNKNIALKLYEMDVPSDKRTRILQRTNAENSFYVEELLLKQEVELDEIPSKIFCVTKDNISIVDKLEGHDSKITILINTKADNIDFVTRHLDEIKSLEYNDIQILLPNINKNSSAFAERFIFDTTLDISHYEKGLVLQNYIAGYDDYIIDVIKIGLHKKYKDLFEYPADCWEPIFKRNLFSDEILGTNKRSFIRDYARARNNNIVQEHDSFIQDALANKDVLKSGLEDITDSKILDAVESKNAIKALDILGKRNLEAAFPLMLDELHHFIDDVAEMKLSPENREALLETFTPENSLKYRDLTGKIKELKTQISKLVGADNIARSNELKAQQAKIEEQLKILKQQNTDKQKLKELQKQAKQLGAQAQSIYYQNENSAQIKELMAQVSTLSKEYQMLIKNAAALDPHSVIVKVRVLDAIIDIADENEVTDFIRMIKPASVENDAIWNAAINRKIFQKLGIEYDDLLSQKLDLINCKYLSQMMTCIDSFYPNMRALISVIKENPHLTIQQAIDNMPQNIKTKEVFENLGFDYEKWTKIDKNSYTSVKIKLDADEAKQAAINNLHEDLNDNLFKIIPKEHTEPIFKALKEQLNIDFVKSQKEIWEGDGFAAGTTEYYRLFKAGKPIEFDDMDDIISLIKKVIIKDDFWTTKNFDSKLEDARGTLYTHLIKMRTQEVDNATNIKADDVADIEVHKTDMYDIKKAIGLGNDAQCCTGLGRVFNEWTAPTYIMNKCIGAIELTDKGAFVGNTMMYLAYVDDTPALVLDNIELKTKYQNNDKIRDTFIEYAKQLCAEIGQPDLPIYAGPNRHKLDLGIYPISRYSMKPIGDTGSQGVYLDYDAARHRISEDSPNEYINMYKIR